MFILRACVQALGATPTGNSDVDPMEVSVEGVHSLLVKPMLRDFFLLMPFLYAVYVRTFTFDPFVLLNNFRKFRRWLICLAYEAIIHTL